MLSIQNATDRQVDGVDVHPTRIAPSRTAHRLERGMVVAVAVGVMVMV